ncbi:hypothetical protein DRO28_02255 [Candidatus Bathyarchaeota archaeon]|nr:MAG: hypothetical protein DRO28_02255 [Candidatus Bathyarchaeota archaeon]
MRVNLVFPPYIAPSCVPIGIAYLKSYVERNLETIYVKTLDLNLEFVDDIVDGKICRLIGKDEIECVNEEILCETAKEIIKNRKLFYDKDLIVDYVAPFFSIMMEYSNHFNSILKLYIEGKIRFDENPIFEYLKEKVKRILDDNPILIGFSTLADSQVNFSISLAKLVKRESDIPVVLGGPAYFNFDLQSLMECFDFIDFIIVKEGEKALLELVKKIVEKDDDYSNVPNLVWRRKGKVVFNRESMIEDLDTLPTPDYSDLELKNYYFPELVLPVSSARNCPWKLCKFCELNAQYGPKYRKRSIDKVIEDLKSLKERYNASNFLFTDSEVTSSRLKELSQAIIDSGLKIYFGCYARPTKSLSLDVLKVAYKSGCRFLMLGVESLSDRYLKFSRKGTTRESIIEVIKNSYKSGIKLLCYMLCGIPTHTREELLSDMKEIADLQKRYKIFSVVYCLFCLGKHQEFYREKEKYKIEVVRKTPVFSPVNSKEIYLESWLEYRYPDRGAYDILKDDDSMPELTSLSEAYEKLMKMTEKFELNGSQKNRAFLSTINNFLFETQLLYAKYSENVEAD